jgi:hypothetical protein
MKLFYIILAGIAGTASMTAFMYLLSYATRRLMKIIKILGTMLLGRTHTDGTLSNRMSTRVVGLFAHYIVGILFAIGYLALWESGVGSVTASWGIFGGLANGIFAMVIWYFFFMIHPKPPIIALEPYLITLVFAHIVFGFVVCFTYYHLIHPEYGFWR